MTQPPESTQENPLGALAPGPKTRIAVMGLLLAGLVYLVFFYSGGDDFVDPTESGVLPPPTVETPSLDTQLLDTVRDSTREQRLVLEPRPLAHLLATALNVSSGVAQALGMPRRPLPVEFVQTDPSHYRGKYLWFKGRLTKLEGPAQGHPVPGYSIYTAHIQTEEGQPLLFYFSKEPLGDGLQIGEVVRAEGYFFKLRDMTFPTKVERAPVLVGRRLARAFEDWGEVTTLDRVLMDSVLDGRWKKDEETGDSTWVPLGIGENALIEDQADPLWHLAAYARSKTGGTLEEWRRHPSLSIENWPTVHKDDVLVPAGTPMRVMGTFVFGRRYAAPPNPAGIEYWTEAYIQVHDLGGKLIPLWIAQDIGDWTRGEPVEARVFFYKRYTYQPQFGKAEMVIAPVFVGARLDRYATLEHPMVRWTGWIFFGVIVVLILLMLFVARRDRRSSASFEDERVARRRRLRARSSSPRIQSDAPAEAEQPHSGAT